MQLAYSISIRAPRAYRLALSVFFFIQGIIFASWAIRIPDIKQSLQLSDAELGWMLLAIPGGQLAGMALSGYLVSRFGSRLMMLTGAFLYPAALVLVGAAGSMIWLASALVFFGLCGNLINIAANTQAVGVELLYRRSILASFHGLWSLAGFTGGLIGQFMVSHHQTPLLHYAIILAITLLLIASSAAYLLPRDVTKSKHEKTSIFVKPDNNIILLGFITFACMICEGTMFDWSGVYFEKEVHAPLEWSRLGYIAFMSAMASGRFAADYFITRFGVKPMLKGSGLVILTGLLLSVIFPSIIPATIGFLLVGLGVASVVPMSYSLAGRSKKIAPGVALAMVSSIGFFGFLLGPPIIGFVAEGFGLRWSFTLIAVLGLGTTLLAGRLKNDE